MTVGAHATFIRTRHPYGFRSGQWAKLITVVPANGRDCYLVEFADQTTDLWVVEDAAAEYEFAPGEWGGRA